MDFLYNNKFLVSILLGLLISIVFYNYNKINHDRMNTIPNEDDKIYINNDNQNKASFKYAIHLPPMLRK